MWGGGPKIIKWDEEAPKKKSPSDPEEGDRGKVAMNEEGEKKREGETRNKCWQREVFKKGHANYKNGLKGNGKACYTLQPC